MRAAQQSVPPQAKVHRGAEKHFSTHDWSALLPRPVFWFALLFFGGYSVGLMLGRLKMPQFGTDFAQYYLDRQNFTAFGTVFATLFTAAFAQLTFLVLSGFCALGMGLLVLFFALKGALLGLCTAALFAAGGAKGLVIYWLLTWLPEIALLLLTLYQAACAAGVCGGVFHIAMGNSMPHYGIVSEVRTCLKSYIATSFLSVLFCGLGAGAALFFAAVLL